LLASLRECVLGFTQRLHRAEVDRCHFYSQLSPRHSRVAEEIPADVSFRHTHCSQVFPDEFFIIHPPYRGHFGIARSVHLSVPWGSCLGCRHAGCLQLSHRWPPEMCRLRTVANGLRTHLQTDIDPPRFLIGGETTCHRRTAIGGGAYRLALPGAIPSYYPFASTVAL